MACTDPLGHYVSFVTSIPVTGAPATGTFELTNDSWCVTKATRFPPPPKRRATSSSMLTDGTRFPASIYDNRTLELRLTCESDNTDALAVQIQGLMRQLTKPQNILMVRQSTTEAVYFRTYGVTPDEVDIITQQQNIARVNVDVIAEPFGYGAEQISGTYTISQNPAVTGTGVTGMYFDVIGVKGDVEAPVRITSLDIANGISYTFSTRRRGDPSRVPFLLQAEDMSVETDTTTQPNDPLMSGYTGNNYTRTTYATNATLVRRLSKFPYPSLSDPNEGTPDIRGDYRVWARMRHTTAATINAQLRYDGRDSGDTVLQNKVFSKATSANTFFWADLGQVQMPLGLDIPFDGPSGVENGASGLAIGLYLERVSGTGSTDVDFLIFVPADEKYLTLTLGSDAFPDSAYVLDSYNDEVYPRDVGSGGAPWSVAGSAEDTVLGYIPELLPDETNRIYFFSISDGGPGINQTRTLDVRYWPRYLSLRAIGL